MTVTDKQGNRAELRPCPTCGQQVIHSNTPDPLNRKFPCAWCGTYHHFKLRAT